MDPVLDTAPCGYLTFTDEGLISTVNHTLAALLGYKRQELHGQHLETILGVGGRIFYHTHFFPVLRLQGQAEEVYFALRSRVGNDIPVLTNAVRRERDGCAVNECVFVRMLQRSRYEDEILHAKQTAEAASDAKAKFLSMMSHELRTPLQAISAYCDLLSQGASGPLTAEQASDLRAIQGASQDLVSLLNDILDFARVDSGTGEIVLQPVRLDQALTRAETLIMPQLLKARLKYSRHGCRENLSVRANPDRLQQVLLNLLTNAIKFTPLEGEISLECRADDTHTHIAIRDTGCGIAHEELDRIFEPFVQVDRHRVEMRQRGVGLGLPISRKLVRAMGGDLTVSSTLGAGSTFTVSLPTAQATADTDRAAA